MDNESFPNPWPNMLEQLTLIFSSLHELINEIHGSFKKKKLIMNNDFSKSMIKYVETTMNNESFINLWPNTLKDS